jgi:hypothetical protein
MLRQEMLSDDEAQNEFDYCYEHWIVAEKIVDEE